MKIVFFGTPYFAATTLQYLIEKGNHIVAVVTPPDSRKGRGNKLKACAVKETSILNDIPILQPEKLKSDQFINILKNFKAEVFVVVAFKKIPEAIWKIPKKGTVNLHTSLLPNYRGAAPINRVLINGEQETGVSTFFIDHDIDSGAIIQQEKVCLTNKTTAAQLHEILANKGANLLASTLNAIKNKSANRRSQKHRKNLLKAPKLSKELLQIDWQKSADDIHNLVRGLSPFLDENTRLKDVSICPSAWFLLEDKSGVQKRIKLNLTEIVNSESKDFLSIKTDNKTYLYIITYKNAISVLNLQVEGKKPMSIQQFLQGNKITKNHKIVL